MPTERGSALHTRGTLSDLVPSKTSLGTSIAYTESADPDHPPRGGQRANPPYAGGAPMSFVKEENDVIMLLPGGTRRSNHREAWQTGR